jgi:hypothetical protein
MAGLQLEKIENSLFGKKHVGNQSGILVTKLARGMARTESVLQDAGFALGDVCNYLTAVIRAPSLGRLDTKPLQYLEYPLLADAVVSGEADYRDGIVWHDSLHLVEVLRDAQRGPA